MSVSPLNWVRLFFFFFFFYYYLSFCSSFLVLLFDNRGISKCLIKLFLNYMLEGVSEVANSITAYAYEESR